MRVNIAPKRTEMDEILENSKDAAIEKVKETKVSYI